jgi:hypothetical protein
LSFREGICFSPLAAAIEPRQVIARLYVAFREFPVRCPEWRIPISLFTVAVVAVKLIEVEATRLELRETTAFKQLSLMDRTSLTHY